MVDFLDIQLRADPDFPTHQLLSALYGRLHRALVQLGSEDIGIGFPGHDERTPSLGDRVRLHGPGTSLNALMKTGWLAGMHDHLQTSPIAAVPGDARHLQVLRVQAKSSPARLRRRAMRRHGLDADSALQKIPDAAAEHLRLPFVMLGSRSTGQASFPLFIRHGPLLAKPISGTFSSYGLSRGATIPWF